MIIVKRMGGLGNQLFQIANGYSLSKEYNKKLIISTSTNENLIGVTPRHTLNLLNDNFEFTNHILEDTIYKEPFFNYKKIDLSNTKNVLLDGYFQSEKYFINYNDEIKNLFLNSFNSSPFIKSKKIDECFQNNTISLHIRRSDYLKFPGIHPCCSDVYYKKALNFLNSESKMVYIFSDDINYCKNNETFRKLKNKKFVIPKINTEYDTLIDFYNMLGCNHHIISNSTFSWWSSYLSKSKNKKIIAPRQWFGNDFKQDFSDIYTKEMILF